MKIYELTYIISPEETSEQAQQKAREIESYIQNKEGVVLKHSDPVARTLSYPIKKSASGFFGALEFQLEPDKMPELKQTMDKDENIIRHMIIIKKAAELRKERRTKIKTEEPAATAAATEETTTVKEKVELKDIEQKLDELLGE